MDRVFDFGLLSGTRIWDFSTSPPGWVIEDEVAASNFLKNGIIDHYFRTRTVPKPVQLWVALYIGNPIAGGIEAVGPGYARQRNDPNDANWLSTQGDTVGPSTGISGQTSNAVPLFFPDATGDWGGGVIDHVAVYDAQNGGNIVATGVVPQPFAVSSGDAGPYFDIGALVVEVL